MSRVPDLKTDAFASKLKYIMIGFRTKSEKRNRLRQNNI